MNVSVGTNDASTSIVCLYGNRLEDVNIAQRDPSRNFEVTVARGGIQQVVVCVVCCVLCVCVCVCVCVGEIMSLHARQYICMTLRHICVI